jgi:hypothetical protein
MLRGEGRNKDGALPADNTRRAGDRGVARSRGVRAERCWMEQGQETNQRERENRRQLLLLGESEMNKLLREEEREKTTATGVGFL